MHAVGKAHRRGIDCQSLAEQHTQRRARGHETHPGHGHDDPRGARPLRRAQHPACLAQPRPRSFQIEQMKLDISREWSCGGHRQRAHTEPTERA